MVNIFFKKLILNFCMREVFFLLPFPSKKVLIFLKFKKTRKNQNLRKIRYCAKLEMRGNKY